MKIHGQRGDYGKVSYRDDSVLRVNYRGQLHSRVYGIFNSTSSSFGYEMYDKVSIKISFYSEYS